MRHIDEVVVHCTATPEGRETAVAEIDAWHRARGWSGCGYHRIVGLHAERWAGRPIEKIGAHVAGHNTGTVGLVYVGGVAADGRTAKDTRTKAQKEALEAELIDLRDRFGIKKVSGHNEYAAKACPSFDASAEYDHMFPEGGFVQREKDEILERGDIGPAVNEWRHKLAQHRRMIDHPYPVTVVGPFDQTLELVTIWFQKERDIVADGKVGPQTLEEMDLALAGKPPFQALPGNDVDLDQVRYHLKQAQSALGA